jgi:hypothetical protein
VVDFGAMATCFVIQPFDRGPFDKRYADVHKPAIEAAGLVPYRVDQDPNASIPIDTIEQEIRNAAMCLADITLNNPNVWFELGYALACGKEVVLVCAKRERSEKYPFDVQHRHVIEYDTESPSDFEKLRAAITGRVQAGLKKAETLGQLASSPVKETHGLRPHEIACLTVVLAAAPAPEDYASEGWIQRDMEAAGFNRVAIGLALRTLVQKGMLDPKKLIDHDAQEEYQAYGITDRGAEWLIANQDGLELRT